MKNLNIYNAIDHLRSMELMLFMLFKLNID